MKLTKEEEAFLDLCLRLRIVNPVPTAVKLGFPEAEVREYFRKRSFEVSPEGWLVLKGVKHLGSTKFYMRPNRKKSGKSKLRIGKPTGNFPKARKA